MATTTVSRVKPVPESARLDDLDLSYVARRLRTIAQILYDDVGEALAGCEESNVTTEPEGGGVMATPRRSDRPGLLLWLNTTVKARARRLTERGVAREEMTVRPGDTLRAAGISSRRQANYQRRMSQLLGQGGARS